MSIETYKRAIFLEEGGGLYSMPLFGSAHVRLRFDDPVSEICNINFRTSRCSEASFN